MHKKIPVMFALALLFALSPVMSGFASAAHTPTVQEKQLLGLVNAKRTAKKAPLLTLDIALSQCARARAEDYLSTTGYPEKAPRLGTIMAQLDAASIAVSEAAQFLARTDYKKAVAGWPEPNIIAAKYTHAGVGIATSGSKTMVVLLLVAYTPPMAAPSISLTSAPTVTAATPSPAPTAVPAPTAAPAATATPAPSATAVSAVGVTRNLDGTPSAMETDMIKSLNGTRTAANMSKYLIDKALQKAAQNRAWHIAGASDYKAAASSATLSSELRLYKVRYTSATQGLLHGKSDVDAALKALLSSSTQKSNLLSASYTRMGVGIASQPTGELIYVIYYTKV